MKETIEWIPVGEKAPGFGYYLIKCIREYSFKDNTHNPSILTAYFSKEGYWWSPFFHEDEEPKVTHYARIQGPGER